MAWPRFPYAVVGRLVSPGPLANLLDAPWLLLVEFGLGGIACLLVTRGFWSSMWRGAGLRLLMISGILGTLALFIVRSDVHRIDYAFRVAIMPATVVAAICAGALLNPETVRSWARRGVRPVVAVGVLLGLAVGFYELPATAFRRAIEQRPALVEAGALAYLRTETPADAVVQGEPATRYDLGTLVDRQLGVVGPECAHVGVFRPLDPDRMLRSAANAEAAFSTESAATAHAILADLGVEYILVGRRERQRFGELEQFNDAGLFEIVYGETGSDHAVVYRLRRSTNTPPVSQSASEGQTGG
jgi:uncharacterized membrane protein